MDEEKDDDQLCNFTNNPKTPEKIFVMDKMAHISAIAILSIKSYFQFLIESNSLQNWQSYKSWRPLDEEKDDDQ